MIKKNRKKLAILFVLILSIVTLAGCNSNTTNNETNDETNSETNNSSTDSGVNTTSGTVESLTLTAQYGEEDTDSSWDESTSTIIQLNGASIEVTGDGATVTDSTVTISQAGTYVLRGTLEDGQVVIDSDTEALVRLVLDGAEMSSSTSAPIYAKQADKLVLILAEGSTNTITDAADYVYADTETDEPNAAIYSQDDMTINGTGSLTVTGNYNNGIGSQDDLVIISGTITVTAENIAIKGKDSLTIADGTFSITSNGDGLKSNNDTDTEKGWILIENGVFDITAKNEGIQAETDLLILDGTFNIVTNGGSANVSSSTSGSEQEEMMRPGEDAGSGASTEVLTTTTADDTATEDTTESDSYKGIKSGTGLEIRGGTITIDSADDAIHSNGNVIIQAGDLDISTGDDGMHADETLLINGGTINIAKSYEGLEGSTIIINDGTINLYASDDGINAAGGSDGTTEQGAFGKDQFGTSGDYCLYINGGFITVEASGDGLDSNGDIVMNGGTVLVNGPTNSGNGALDYDGSFTISGGILVAAGSSGMALATSDTSTQAAIMLYYSSAQSADTLVHIESSDGTSILSFAPTKQYETILISTPEITTGSSYKIYSGGSNSATSVNGLYTGGTYTPGTEVIELTLESVVTSISDTGSAVSSGGMGGMGGGNMQGGGRGGTAPEAIEGESMEIPEGGMGGPSGERPDGAPDGNAFPEESSTTAE